MNEQWRIYIAAGLGSIVGCYLYSHVIEPCGRWLEDGIRRWRLRREVDRASWRELVDESEDDD